MVVEACVLWVRRSLVFAKRLDKLHDYLFWGTRIFCCGFESATSMRVAVDVSFSMAVFYW